MSSIKEISSLNEPGLEVFGQLTEAQLRNALDPEKGIFIAESRYQSYLSMLDDKEEGKYRESQ